MNAKNRCARRYLLLTTGILFIFLCTNDKVVFNVPDVHYSSDILILDSISGDTLRKNHRQDTLSDFLHPGQKVLIDGILIWGDTALVKPDWNIISKANNCYSFYHSFASSGNIPVIFTICDSAGFRLHDTLIVQVKKVDGALIFGKAFLHGKADHRNINVRLFSSNTVDTFYTDSSGIYAGMEKLTPGTYSIEVMEVESGFLYNNAKLSNINVLSGRLNYIPDVTLQWSYSITALNMFLPNDTIIPPKATESFPVTVTDMHGSNLIYCWYVNGMTLHKSSSVDTFDYTFKDEGLYNIKITSADSIHQKSRADSLKVLVTRDRRIIINAGCSATVNIDENLLFSSKKNRMMDSIICFSWDLDGDSNYERDSLLSSNAIWSFSRAGIYNTTCKSLFKNGSVVYDTFHVNVQVNELLKQYESEIHVIDLFSMKEISINQDVYTGQKLLFTSSFNKGDTSRIRPLWRIGNSDTNTINAFLFERTFTDTGLINIFFCFSDSTNTSVKDTFSLHVRNTKNGGEITGRCLFKDKSVHQGISVNIIHNNITIKTVMTDNTGQYLFTGIDSGDDYLIVFSDSSGNSEYTRDTLSNISVKKGSLHILDSIILVDTTGPHITDISLSDFIFNDTLSFYAEFSDFGAGVDTNSSKVIINDSTIDNSKYTCFNNRLYYSSKSDNGVFNIKALVKDSAGNASDTFYWTFAIVDTTNKFILAADDSIEVSINDTVLFFPGKNWLDQKYCRFQIECGAQILRDSLNVENATFIFKDSGTYILAFKEYKKGILIHTSFSKVRVVQDIPEVSLLADTLYNLDTPVIIKVNINQRFGKIISYEWRIGDSILITEKSSDLTISPHYLPERNIPYIVSCIDDDSNLVSDTAWLSFGKWNVLGNKGITDSAGDLQIVVCNETPYIAGIVDPVFGMKLIPMKFTGTNWEKAGDMIKNYVFNFSLSGENFPMIAYINASNALLRIMFATYSGDRWISDSLAEGLSSNAFDPKAISLSFDRNIPYLSYVSVMDTSGKLMKKTNSGWANVTDDVFSSDSISNVRLLFSNGIPYVAFKDSSVTKHSVFVKKYENNQWLTIGGGSAMDQVSDYAFCFNKSIPFISAIDETNRFITIRTTQGNLWGPASTISEGSSDCISLCSFRNCLFAAFNDQSRSGKAVVKMLRDNKWYDLGCISESSAKSINMTCDTNNIFVVFSDSSCNGKTTVVKLR